MADAEALPGTARLAGWLGRTILNLVRGYSQPGDRVLLLAPPLPPQRAARVPTASASHPYAGLTEAIWTITRLGRSVDTATGSPGPANPHDESAGDYRLDRRGRRTPPDRRHVIGDSIGRFDLIITAVYPDATDWLAQTHRDLLLTPTGVLAVLTHSDAIAGREHDAVTVVVRTLRDQSMSWLDHIAVLHQPHPPAEQLEFPQPSQAHGQVIPAPAAGPLPLHLVHHDLLLFGPAKACISTTAPSERTDHDTDEAADSSDE